MKKLFLLFSLLCPLVLYAQIQKERKWAIMHFIDENYTESFREYCHLAKYKDPDDLACLAMHYDYGHGTEHDKKMAIKYYKMAADLGNRMSQATLCDFYYDDEEIESEQEKKDLYKYSRMFNTNFEYSDTSGNDDDEAGYALYLCYKNGWGTQKNLLLANIWLAYAAFNDSMLAQDEFCEKNNLNGDYDSEEEESALAFTYFRYLYEHCLPYLKEDKSLEMSFFRIKYLLTKQTPNDALKGLKETLVLYENNELDDIGKAVLFDVIKEFGKYDNAINEKYASDAEKYELISDEEKITWEHIQLTKETWKVDVMLNKSNRHTGSYSGHEWVDLGLPSGTKWSTRNIGAETPIDQGYMFAWAENKPKNKYTSDNYIADKNLLIMDSTNDTAHQLFGDKWNVPSCEDWEELFSYCDIKYDSQNNTIIVTSPNNQYMTIPFIQNTEKDGVIYWTSTCVSSMEDPKKDSAISLLLDSEPDWRLIYVENWRGCPIRPVFKDNQY